MADKRKYSLSAAAIAQRKAASKAAQLKRVLASLPPPIWPDVKPCSQTAIATVMNERAERSIFDPLPKDAPHSEHQRRAALIRVRQIRNGTLKVDYE